MSCEGDLDPSSKRRVSRRRDAMTFRDLRVPEERLDAREDGSQDADGADEQLGFVARRVPERGERTRSDQRRQDHDGEAELDAPQSRLLGSRLMAELGGGGPEVPVLE